MCEGTSRSPLPRLSHRKGNGLRERISIRNFTPTVSVLKGMLKDGLHLFLRPLLPPRQATKVGGVGVRTLCRVKRHSNREPPVSLSREFYPGRDYLFPFYFIIKSRLYGS